MTETLIVLGCVALCLGVGVSPLPPITTVDPSGPRGRAIRRAEQQFAAAVMLIATCGLLSLWLVGKRGDPWWPLGCLMLIATPLVHPWLLVKWLLVPLGAVRTATRVARLAGHPWFRDPVGGSVLSGVLASLRRRRHDPARARWLRARLASDRLGGAGIVALGLIAADAGDRDTARRLLGTLDEIEPDICPDLARMIALDWLVADAARRGAWYELVDRISDDPFPTPTTRFVGMCARRMLGEDVRRRSLVWAWLWAPRRLATAGLLFACLRTARPIPRVIEDDELGALPANEGREPVMAAMALHAEAAAWPATLPVPVPVIERLAAAWDRAFGDFGLRADVRERVDALAAKATGELVVARMQRAVARDLAVLLCQAGRDAERITTTTGVLRRARDLQFDDASATILAACAALARKRTDSTPTVDVWTEWVGLRRSYAVSVLPLSPGQRAVLYGLFEQEVRTTAAWLWNDRRERGLAHAICLFLLAEAERVHDTEAAAYYRHNVVVGL